MRDKFDKLSVAIDKKMSARKKAKKNIIASLAKQSSYGDKRDYPKIEIFVNRKYVATTTWAKSCKEAKEKYLEKHPESSPYEVECKMANS